MERLPDSEEVIVANQNGKNTPNDNYKFEYVTGAIEQCEKIGGAPAFYLNFQSKNIFVIF